jgi:hypothetical protein
MANDEPLQRTLFIVSRGEEELYVYLQDRFATDGAVTVILDRRVLERRLANLTPERQRRRTNRRRRPDVDAELRIRSHAIVTLPEDMVPS